MGAGFHTAAVGDGDIDDHLQSALGKENFFPWSSRLTAAPSPVASSPTPC